MIQSAGNYKVAALFNPDERIKYEIPKYQREYVWGKREWDNLYDDIYENQDHFLGSMICINRSVDALEVRPLEIIDGQQRLLTISILYLVIYARLMEERKKWPDDDDLLATTVNLKNRLLQKSDGGKTLKVVPSYQNNNHSDYCSLLSENGLFHKQNGKVLFAGNRRIYKVFKYFQTKLQEESKDQILEFLDRLNSASIVKIEVANHADAFTLFESLNNRGVPLSPMDIIKNKMLAELEKLKVMSTEDAFEHWNRIITHIPEYRDQERFLRQYYNAFRYMEEVRFPGISKATKSKLITIYENLIEKDPSKTLQELVQKAKIYGNFSVSFESRNGEEFRNHLFDLQNVGGAPGYTLLLYILSEHGEKENLALKTSELLAKYFIRRNITDFPGTRDLDKIFIDAIDFCEARRETLNINMVKEFLTDRKRFAPDQRFREMLAGDIYDNPEATRFVLTKIEEARFTKENKPNFWERDNNNNLVWTIEHIFPKGENIPDSWVEAIADGDKEKAKLLQDQWVHKLGNLTLTAYNQYLSTYSFEKKRDRTDTRGNPIGYKNGLFLNSDLRDKENWTTKDIKQRTEKLVNLAFELFRV
ncbi:MAG TPA: DUF262 domain-containing HNH endonuclease family protein [Mesotoga infera]|nr:DUF262 domain-containing HNH endonuclease family protein [Mesotoga infera]